MQPRARHRIVLDTLDPDVHSPGTPDTKPQQRILFEVVGGNHGETGGDHRGRSRGDRRLEAPAGEQALVCAVFPHDDASAFAAVGAALHANDGGNRGPPAGGADLTNHFQNALTLTPVHTPTMAQSSCVSQMDVNSAVRSLRFPLSEVRCQ